MIKSYLCVVPKWHNHNFKKEKGVLFLLKKHLLSHIKQGTNTVLDKHDIWMQDFFHLSHHNTEINQTSDFFRSRLTILIMSIYS